MVKRFKQTLADERGATLLMALFALLLATMACVVILGAATSSVKQEHAERAALQDEITLKSAGTMLADNMTSASTKCTLTVTTVTTEKNNQKPTTTVTKSTTVSDYCLISSIIRDPLTTFLESGESSIPTERTFYIKASSAEVKASDPGVSEGREHGAYASSIKVLAVIAPDCSITFTMELMEGSKTKETLYLKMKSSKKDLPTETATTTGNNSSTTTAVDKTVTTWVQPTFYREGDEQS